MAGHSFGSRRDGISYRGRQDKFWYWVQSKSGEVLSQHFETHRQARTFLDAMVPESKLGCFVASLEREYCGVQTRHQDAANGIVPSQRDLSWRDLHPIPEHKTEQKRGRSYSQGREVSY